MRQSLGHGTHRLAKVAIVVTRPTLLALVEAEAVRCAGILRICRSAPAANVGESVIAIAKPAVTSRRNEDAAAIASHDETSVSIAQFGPFASAVCHKFGALLFRRHLPSIAPKLMGHIARGAANVTAKVGVTIVFGRIKSIGVPRIFFFLLRLAPSIIAAKFLRRIRPDVAAGPKRAAGQSEVNGVRMAVVGTRQVGVLGNKRHAVDHAHLDALVFTKIPDVLVFLGADDAVDGMAQECLARAIIAVNDDGIFVLGTQGLHTLAY